MVFPAFASCQGPGTTLAWSYSIILPHNKIRVGLERLVYLLCIIYYCSTSLLECEIRFQTCKIHQSVLAILLSPRSALRLLKEVAYYAQEVKDNKAKLEGMKSENRDAHDIKYFQKVLDESYMMVPDSERRLKQALDDLSVFLESCDDATINKSGEWYSTADAILKENSHGKVEDDLPLTDVDTLAEGEAF